MYAAALALILVALLAVAALYGVHRMVTPAPRTLTVLPFQSGWRAQEHALSRYHASLFYYLRWIVSAYRRADPSVLTPGDDTASRTRSMRVAVAAAALSLALGMGSGLVWTALESAVIV